MALKSLDNVLDAYLIGQLSARLAFWKRAKAQYQDLLTTLKAPVSGMVQQLNVHTVGGVVAPAQPLLTLVPDNQPVEVEAMLENKDIGFVHPGQKVSVKVEIFTFTKYGTVAGEVVVFPMMLSRMRSGGLFTVLR